MIEHTKYMLFSNCIPVKGFARSIIYDLMRYDYSYIPNDLYEILIKSKGVINCNEYYNLYINEPESLEAFTEYLNFLLEEEYIFPLNNLDAELFPSMSLEFHSPSIISNAVIDILSNTDLSKIITELEKVHCNYIMLRLQQQVDINYLEKTVAAFNGSIIFHIQLILKYDPSFTEENLKNLTENFDCIHNIIIENTPENLIALNNETTLNILFTNNPAKENYKKNFRINSRLFSEAQQKNTFYNKKIYIGINGEIKNSPYDNEIFGNINNNELKQIVISPEFQKYWSISKDDILICKDCEHRYMCIDPRKPLEKENFEWHFDSECEYDPYTNEWYQDHN